MVETIADIASIVLSARDLWNEPSWTNLGLLLADVGGALAPGLPAVGIARHGAKIFGRADDVADAAKAVTKTGEAAADAGKAAEKTGSKIDRTAFKAEREAFWKAEAKNNPGSYSAENLERMNQGKPPIEPDGHPVELHHTNRTPEGGVEPKTRTDHRLGDNYQKNHPKQ